jgi:hypothetical protein
MACPVRGKPTPGQAFPPFQPLFNQPEHLLNIFPVLFEQVNRQRLEIPSGAPVERLSTS